MAEETATGTVPASPQGWLMRNRTSSRLAFILRIIVMGVGAGISLFWTRWLLEAMGAPLNGLFLTFLAIAQLGGLGDFGFGAAMGVRTIGHLARGENEECRQFLANVRSVFLALALFFLLVFSLLSPWLPGWLGLSPVSGSGSLTLLFVIGGIGVALLIINSYLQNLNYINGNVVWPILPAFLLTQIAFGAQWLLALRGLPLWVQYGVSILTSLVTVVLTWWMLRSSHPWLGQLWPIRFNAQDVRQLAVNSFWVYLATLGNLVFITTDRILINKGFGSAMVPAYRNNYRLCELAITLLGTASFVALPAILRRLLSRDQKERGDGLSGVQRLQKIQVFAACVSAAMYLTFNDVFMRWWLPDFTVPLSWQFAFALTLAISISGDMGVQLPGRLDQAGFRLAGLTIGLAGLLNLALSWVAMKSGSILGITFATVFAQSIMCIVMSRQTCRRLQLPWREWLLKTWLLPVAMLTLVFGIRLWLVPDNGARGLALAGICVILSLVVARVLRISRQMFVDEWKRLRASIG